MKAHFSRKIPDLETLQAATRQVKEEKCSASAYTVTKEVILSHLEFQQFASDLLEDQPWIEIADGGMNEAGEIRCIRVINLLTGERVLVNSEGYAYPRYTALEDPDQ